MYIYIYTHILGLVVVEAALQVPDEVLLRHHLIVRDNNNYSEHGIRQYPYRHRWHTRERQMSRVSMFAREHWTQPQARVTAAAARPSGKRRVEDGNLLGLV